MLLMKLPDVIFRYSVSDSRKPVGFKSWNSLDAVPSTDDTSPLFCMVKNAIPYDNLQKEREGVDL